MAALDNCDWKGKDKLVTVMFGGLINGLQKIWLLQPKANPLVKRQGAFAIRVDGANHVTEPTLRELPVTLFRLHGQLKNCLLSMREMPL